jgi:hypothetical protein
LLALNWRIIIEFAAYNLELSRFPIEIVSGSGKKCGAAPLAVPAYKKFSSDANNNINRTSVDANTVLDISAPINITEKGCLKRLCFLVLCWHTHKGLFSSCSFFWRIT